MSYSTIDKPTDYFNTVLYSGTDSAQAVTGVGFQPDWTWIKCRSNGGSASFEHVLTDAVRGVNKTLVSNDTEAETANNATGYLNIFGSDGFTTAAGGTSIDAVGGAGRTYASWNWLGANGTASNSNGSITSTVSANTTAGFSIVSYTGTGSNATVGHGLGVAPKMIIAKKRSATGTWGVYHESIGNAKGLFLNSTSAQSSEPAFWNSTSPTSSVFSVGTSGDINGSSATQIAYCFAEKQGYSKFGDYAGNNNNGNGTFVNTGFSPAFLMVKRYGGGTQNWLIYDNKRNPFNLTSLNLKPNATTADATNNGVDLLSNGFKFKSNDGDSNGYSDGYIYMAFAENPLVGSNFVPTTAR